MFTPEEYYSRDQSMGLDRDAVLSSHLKKLDLVDFDINSRIESFIKSELLNWIQTNYNPGIDGMTLGEVIGRIKDSKKFKSYLEYLKTQESRATILGTCVYTDFYNLCTQEELEYLGW